MAVNAPEVQILADSDSTVVVKITGQYDAATTANTKVVVANTVGFANTSKDCILSLEELQYSVRVNSGFIALEWHSKVNSNSRIVNFGSIAADGRLSHTIVNNANTPSGDINLVVRGAANNDTYNFILKLRKENQNGAFSNAWARYN